MSSDSTFQTLLAQVRAGDETAAAQLLQQYEPAIRRAIRVRLTDPRLRRVLDSMDVCQSVMANFFVRAHAGQFDLDSPQQLLNLLVTMANNRLRDHARQQQAGRRDQRRVVADPSGVLDAVAAQQDSPSEILAGKELLVRLHQQLSPEERYLADQRGQGREWNDLAAELGVTPDALRIKLTRALNRAAGVLGLDEVEVS